MSTPEPSHQVRPQSNTAARAAFGMIVVSMGAMLGPLDSAVNVAFPAITKSFNLRVSDIQWVVIVYVLAQSSLSIIFGKLGDRYGHRRIFMWGCAACAIVHTIAGRGWRLALPCHAVLRLQHSSIHRSKSAARWRSIPCCLGLASPPVRLPVAS
ncbi:MAG: MFS transporter [Alphaproteobacteria bacterium]|nr:MFS transporter [Alphaproteobacteria bacterium]